jgi:transcriptional regulator with XRE-family HTH domain
MTERPAPDAPEHVRARWWRENVLGLSRRQLADLVGYSETMIKEFEHGRRFDGSPLSLNALTRYRTACAAIEARVRFDWLTCRVGEAKRREL